MFAIKGDLRDNAMYERLLDLAPGEKKKATKDITETTDKIWI